MSQENANRRNEIGVVLARHQKQFTSLLADKKRSDKFIAASLNIAMDSSLSTCSPDSIVNALIGIAQLDLNPDKNIGHAYMIKYGNNVQLQIGYKGLIQLLFRAGWMIKAYPVYECDEFSISFDGWDNRVEFTPDIDAKEDDDNQWVYKNLRGVYVIARNSVTGDEYSDFISKKLIEKSRLKSQNQKKKDKPEHIWFDWYQEMAIKTAIKKLAKKLPLGDDRANYAMKFDDKAEIGEQVDYAKTAEEGFIVDVDGVIQDKSTDLNNIVSEAA